MTDFLSKISGSSISSILIGTLNGIQSSNNKILSAYENTAKLNEHIIPSTSNLFTIGNSHNKYNNAFIENSVYVNNIHNPDILSISATSTVEIYGNLMINSSINIYGSDHINFETPIHVNKLGLLGIKKHCIVVNSNISLTENDSSACLFIKQHSLDNTISILLENDNQNVGYKFESIFIENADSNESYSYKFSSQKNLSGKIYNRIDNNNLYINGSVNGISIYNYSMGDKISFVYTGLSWLISGTIKNIDTLSIL
jgi:hypothetical protein